MLKEGALPKSEAQLSKLTASGQEMFPDDDEVDRRSLTTLGDDPALPYDLTGCESLHCATCNSTPLSPCPLTPAAMLQTNASKQNRMASHPGHHCWRQYKSVKDGQGNTVARKPISKMCGFCPVVYTALGLEEDYTHISEMGKAFAQPTGRESQIDFLQKRAKWCKDQNAIASGGVQEKEADTTLDTISQVGVKTKAPQVDFVEKAHWSTELDGDIEKANIVTEFLYGKNRDGGLGEARARRGVQPVPSRRAVGRGAHSASR